MTLKLMCFMCDLQRWRISFLYVYIGSLYYSDSSDPVLPLGCLLLDDV